MYNEIFDNMGDLLINLYIVDLIIKENTNIDSHWQHYSQMFLIAEANPSKFNISAKNLKKIKKFVKDMHGNLLNGDLYDIYLNGLR